MKDFMVMCFLVSIFVVAMLEPVFTAVRLGWIHGFKSPVPLYSARMAALGIGMIFSVLFLICACVYPGPLPLVGFLSALALIGLGVQSKGLEHGR